MDCGTFPPFLVLFTISLGVYYNNLCRGVSQSD